MPTSAKRQAANKLNALKSTGPKTSAGKKNSSMNALKHGLTAQAAVLPHENAEAFEARRREWLEAYPEDDPMQRALIDQALHNFWKIERCARYENASLSYKARHAVDEHEIAERARVESIGQLLIHDPLNRCASVTRDRETLEKLDKWHKADPAILLPQLERSAEGVEWLLKQWHELGAILEREGYWHYTEKFRAIRLIGKRHENLLDDYSIARIFLACNAAHPEAWDLWDEAIQAKLGCDGKPMYVHRIEAMKEDLPSTQDEGFAQIQALIDSEIKRLNILKSEKLDPRAALDRAQAVDRALFDDSPSAATFHRYETACQREFHRAIAGLTKIRQDAAKSAPAKPVSKDKATPEPDTPAAAEPKPAQPRRLPNEPKPKARNHPHKPKSRAAAKTVDRKNDMS